MSYCIRDSKGQYLTHSVDVQAGTSSLWFTPSPWMAYTFPDREMAEMVADAPDVMGSVEEWKQPDASKHGAWNERMASAIRGLKTEGRNA